MHEPLALRIGLSLFCLAVILLPASYLVDAVKALRTGRLDVVARGVPVLVVRTEEPMRFTVSVAVLLVFSTVGCVVLASLATVALLVL